jgi:hypothetical protein
MIQAYKKKKRIWEQPHWAKVITAKVLVKLLFCQVMTCTTRLSKLEALNFAESPEHNIVLVINGATF